MCGINASSYQWFGCIFILCYNHLNLALLLHKTVLVTFLLTSTVLIFGFVMYIYLGFTSYSRVPNNCWVQNNYRVVAQIKGILMISFLNFQMPGHANSISRNNLLSLSLFPFSLATLPRRFNFLASIFLSIRCLVFEQHSI